MAVQLVELPVRILQRLLCLSPPFMLLREIAPRCVIFSCFCFVLAIPFDDKTWWVVRFKSTFSQINFLYKTPTRQIPDATCPSQQIHTPSELSALPFRDFVPAVNKTHQWSNTTCLKQLTYPAHKHRWDPLHLLHSTCHPFGQPTTQLIRR